MNHEPPLRPRLTRDDSRALDGVLPPAEAARVAREQADDPARVRAVASYREAAGLWADDARRAAQSLDTALLVERVLARGAPPAQAVRSAPWGYAATALVLLALGVAGLWTNRTGPAPALPTDIHDLEQGQLALLRSRELDELRAELRTGGR